MKRLCIAMFTLLILLSALPVQAGNWGLGGSLFDGDWFGVQARKTFFLGGDISEITGGATLYFEDTWFAFDADYHFVVGRDKPSRFYPLVGLDLATDFDYAEIGLNLGGGVDFMLTADTAAWFEAKFVVGDLDGFVGILGIKF